MLGERRLGFRLKRSNTGDLARRSISTLPRSSKESDNESYSFDAALLKVLFAFVPSVVTVAMTVIRIKLNMMAYSVAAAASSSSKNRLIADILLGLQ